MEVNGYIRLMTMVSVSKETAMKLSQGGLVDPVTGEVHMRKRKFGVPLVMVKGKHVRVSIKMCKEPETEWGVGWLGDRADGIVEPKSSTDRFRVRRMVEKGYMVRVGKGRYMIDPNRWSRGGCPVDELPNLFK